MTSEYYTYRLSVGNNVFRMNRHLNFNDMTCIEQSTVNFKFIF